MRYLKCHAEELTVNYVYNEESKAETRNEPAQRAQSDQERPSFPTLPHCHGLNSGTYPLPCPLLTHFCNIFLSCTPIQTISLGFAGGSVVKKLPVSSGDVESILGWEDPLEKVMATHSSNLACEIL